MTYENPQGQPQPQYAQPPAPAQQAPAPQAPTQHAPLPQAPAAPYAQAAYVQPVVPARPTSGLAIAGFVCALVGPTAFVLAALTSVFVIPAIILGLLAPLATILAIIFGHIAMSQTKKRDLGGRGLAVAAVIMGWIEFGLSILGLIVAGGLILSIIGMASTYSAGGIAA